LGEKKGGSQEDLLMLQRAFCQKRGGLTKGSGGNKRGHIGSGKREVGKDSREKETNVPPEKGVEAWGGGVQPTLPKEDLSM